MRGLLLLILITFLLSACAIVPDKVNYKNKMDSDWENLGHEVWVTYDLKGFK